MRRLLPLLLLAGCGGKAAVTDPMKFHADALAATEPAALGAAAPGSAAQKEAVARFKAFFGDLKEDSVKANIRSVYAADVWFNDTLKSIRGVDALEHYLVDTARSVESCKVDVDEIIPSAAGVYVRWRMHIKFKKFRRGETNSSIGVTLLRFDKDGRVAYHQDYWDSGANLFEKVPVLGAGIRAVKRRL
ncbi:MAG: nuclear transport factor 2 family protein [Elusimicrobiota bacterium]|nr:MAG: nuclear transport factor 2 family protein [Elusimicrobiota bacterium]